MRFLCLSAVRTFSNLDGYVDDRGREGSRWQRVFYLKAFLSVQEEGV